MLIYSQLGYIYCEVGRSNQLLNLVAEFYNTRNDCNYNQFQLKFLVEIQRT